MKRVDARRRVYQDELDVLDDPQALLAAFTRQVTEEVREAIAEGTPVQVRQWTIPEMDAYVVAAAAVVLEPADYDVLREALDVLIDAYGDAEAQGDSVDPKRKQQAKKLRQAFVSARFGNVVVGVVSDEEAQT